LIWGAIIYALAIVVKIVITDIKRKDEVIPNETGSLKKEHFGNYKPLFFGLNISKGDKILLFILVAFILLSITDWFSRLFESSFLYINLLVLLVVYLGAGEVIEKHNQKNGVSGPVAFFTARRLGLALLMYVLFVALGFVFMIFIGSGLRIG
jgi:hypothetical protein